MNKLVIVFLLVLNTHYVTLVNKCCDADSYLKKKNNSIYECDRDEDKRLQIFSQDVNFFNTVTEGTCLDTNASITEYTFKNQTVLDEKPIEVNFFPKCCPLRHFYDSVTHACVRTNNMNEGFIKQNFIRVGLPQCKVIVDYKLTSGGNQNYRIESDGSIYIEKNSFSDQNYCIDKDENDSLIARGCFNDLSVCYDSMRCIHKCCPDGQSFVNGKHCLNTYVHGVNLSFTQKVNSSEDPFGVIHNFDCSLYILKKESQFYVDTDGTFFAFINLTNSFARYGIEDKSYCIEHVRKGRLNNFEFFMCYSKSDIANKFLISRWAKIFSIVFICITIVVYLFLPEMLNLFGKILVSYCASMFAVLTLLTYTQFETNISDKSCVNTSFISSYMSLSAFSWLNVMCFNIWWTFGTPKPMLTSTQKRSELKRFLMYSMYGWGLPGVLTILTYLAFAVFDTPNIIRPYLGAYKCFWERRDGNYGMFLFYIIPLILMESANMVLFMRTIFYCLKVKSEINRMNDNRMSTKEKRKSYNIDKEQLVLILKLSITMGISFVFEVVSSLFTFGNKPVLEYIEIVWDTINCLQGVFIFFIFVFKVKVYRLCRNRIQTAKDRKISVSSFPTGTTQVSEPLNSKPKITRN